MEYRDLGRTGLKVSEIGFGAWAIGGDAWGPVEDADSLAASVRPLLSEEDLRLIQEVSPLL
jgi:dTDP-4-dehydrorhamnose reductase